MSTGRQKGSKVNPADQLDTPRLVDTRVKQKVLVAPDVNMTRWERRRVETSGTIDEGVKEKNEEMKLNVKHASKWSDAKDLVIMKHKTNADEPMRRHMCSSNTI